MAVSSLHGVRLSQTSPAFLHANSTSHTWIFSALAELVDNAYDPDVNAANMWIDKLEIDNKVCLVLTDDGRGCAPDKLHKMLSFGYCEKIDIKGHKPIGQYGNGFKSGSMRLGKDALVLTKHGRTMSAGFLSQTFLEAIGSETVLVPVATWTKKGFKLVEEPDAAGSVKAILKYSLFHTEDQLLSAFQAIRSGSGTRIFIYNLNRTSDGHLELDFESDKLDMINSEHQELDYNGGLMSRPVREHMPEYRRSLREYLSTLFLKPRMKITLRGCRIKTKLIRKSLRKTRKTTYTPTWMMVAGKKGVEIIFGFGPSKLDYGIMMYHRNRLIKAYEHVGVQKQANEMGVGVVGVVEVDFLEAIHNKQDFSKTDRYNACISALGIKLNQYWNAITGNADSASEFLRRPDWTWVQCEQCLKWRRLPEQSGDSEVPEKWYCYMNPDMSHNRCDIDEEPEHEDEVFRLVASKNSKKKKSTIQPNDNTYSADTLAQCGLGAPLTVIKPGGNSARTPRGSRAAGQGPEPRRIVPKTEPGTQIKSEFPSTNGEASTSQLGGSIFSKRKQGEVIDLDSSDTESGDGEKSPSRQRPKKKRYTETQDPDGMTVLVLPSSDDEMTDSDDDDDLNLPAANIKQEKEPEPNTPKISVSQTSDGRTMISFSEPAAGAGASNNRTTSAEPDTSSANHDKETVVKSEVEMDLRRELAKATQRLKESSEKLSSLRSNIRTLLKILVPNFQLEDPELVDRVVVEMILVNGEGKEDSHVESSVGADTGNNETQRKTADQTENNADKAISVDSPKDQPTEEKAEARVVTGVDDSVPTSSVDDTQNTKQDSPLPEVPFLTETPTTEVPMDTTVVQQDNSSVCNLVDSDTETETWKMLEDVKQEKDLLANWSTEGNDVTTAIDLDEYDED